MIAGFNIKNRATAKYLAELEAAFLRSLQIRGAYVKPAVFVLVKLAVQLAKHGTLIHTDVRVGNTKTRPISSSDIHDLIDHLWANVDENGDLTA